MEEKPWRVVDYTKKTGGYLRLMYRGRRVADFFPFAKDADELWVREQAEHIAGVMNREDDRRHNCKHPRKIGNGMVSSDGSSESSWSCPDCGAHGEMKTPPRPVEAEKPHL